ncbi:helix-turn-helix domain-containing protein [Nocardioides ganghwensis]|uniref:XRE family transcriptional regulator n=1 Tax=Nocardioides ganghwensis TaxID=252230 RepID=A0A4Q2SGY8_9ACTN|nr:helix-turn-helix transcriptional regulator [Nocardioides ganghwensis]MBD3946345.1 helix-turn-helix transcriptional regulator [Nocardioides ganghwensis]RYC03108.1 XRE family transcriptional regulator [Nocardioides ganghwensis]
MAGKQLPSGPTSATTRANIAHFRTEAGMTYAELSRELERRGHLIPPLGLRRIESGERRVDVDDLVALALALDVNPNALLMPRERGSSIDCAVTGYSGGPLHTAMAWRWATGHLSLTRPPNDSSSFSWQFMKRVRPAEVLTDDERHEKRRTWVSTRIAVIEEELKAEIAAVGEQDADPSHQWEMEALAALNVADDAQWAAAGYDPAPPSGQDRA